MIDASLYIDDANKNLWKMLNQSFNISIEYCSENCYGNYHKNKDCIIYVPKNLPDSASFTHELLHLYLPYKSLYIGSAIQLMLQNEYPLNIIFNERLYDHISNSLEHVKMLPVYLNLGYPIEKFLSDYSDVKLTNSDVDYISNGYKKGIFCTKYNKTHINYFIGKFFAGKADINTNNHYDQQMSALYNIDHELFSILDKFWNGWIDYDIEKERQTWENNYHDLVDVLVDGLIDWSKNKKIV